MKTIRLLSFHHIANFGGVLFAYHFLQAMQSLFPGEDVRFLDVKSKELAVYEQLKRLRLFPGIPLYYAHRFANFKAFREKHFALERSLPQVLDLNAFERRAPALDWDAIIVGMDVWNVERLLFRPNFPNIYWLPQTVKAKKIAYSVSGYQSDPQLLKANKTKLRDRLNAFSLIGARDDFTVNFIQQAGIDGDIPVIKIPDITFLDVPRDTAIKDRLIAQGVDFSRPRLGMLIFENSKLSQPIIQHYRKRGYQIIASSSYNPDADVNLGHVFDPFEWADSFRYFDLVFTEFYHGAIYSLLHNTPFIAFPRPPYVDEQCKTLDILRIFDLERNYARVNAPDFSMGALFEQADQVEKEQSNKYALIEQRINMIREQHKEFHMLIRSVV